MNLIDRLPPNSFFHQALSEDPEVAEQLARMKAEGDDEEYRPPQALYGPVEDLLTDVANQLRALRAEAISIQGGKPNQPKFRPGPRTALAAAEARVRAEEHAKLTARLLPGRRSDN